MWYHREQSTISVPDGTKPLPESMLTNHHQQVCVIHMKAITHEMCKICILDMNLNIVKLRLQLYLPGAHELTHSILSPVLM